MGQVHGGPSQGAARHHTGQPRAASARIHGAGHRGDTGHGLVRAPAARASRSVQVRRVGNAKGGSLDDLLNALSAGQPILTFNAVYFNASARVVAAQKFEWECALTGKLDGGATNELITPPRFHNIKRDPFTGKLHTHDFILGSERARLFASNKGYEMNADPCWTPASADRTGRQTSVAHLIGAILNVHRVRVVVDDLSFDVDQVEVQGHTVTFGAAVYLDPASPGPFSNTSSKTVRLKASTDGKVSTCSTAPQSRQSYYETSYTASVTCFVDTRPWRLVFSVTTEADLQKAVQNGASLQIGLSNLHGTYALLTTRAVELYQTHVAAQMSGPARMDGVVCELMAVLVTSKGGVRMHEYQVKNASARVSVSNIVIDWFVDPFSP
ncbi:hypothetical protein V1264_014280 [Littorina saxatilis]|uniref:Uncharacterized protein n=1 Tax=Littorina saxatilis TaxID=31220 RepID=A0AAN9BRP6_9CAEN